MNKHKLGIAGRCADFFQAHKITPLLALAALLLGLLALLVTPREEEPQIDVTMANVLVPFAGAKSDAVESMVVRPLELVLNSMQGVEHISAVSMDGMAQLSVQFKVGISRELALSRLYDAIDSNADIFQRAGAGVPSVNTSLQSLVKPKGIEDVPILVLTLYLKDATSARSELEAVALGLQTELARVAGVREVQVLGASSRAWQVEVDPMALAAHQLTMLDISRAIDANNQRYAMGSLLDHDQQTLLYSGSFISSLEELRNVLISNSAGAKLRLADIATVSSKALEPSEYLWHSSRSERDKTAVAIAISKQNGSNASDVANAVIAKIAELDNVLLPANIGVNISRNYGATADAKANTLMQKLLFATLSVVLLVLFSLGVREALIIGAAVILTLLLTLFASLVYGFTLNRVSLFALIFSIGILVDDAIVVVENIHRHRQLYPQRSMRELIPAAVDEVGGPTILATFTVLAALLPMAFVSGLMGPYMSPIPINASMGMLLSLAIAFIFTPFLAGKYLQSHSNAHAASVDSKFFNKIFAPFLGSNGRRWRWLLSLATLLLIAISLALPISGQVILKMLPFDNKSELQVVIDMPADSSLERNSALLQELGEYLLQQPEVENYQAYAGSHAPISFNGLVRQYYMRSGAQYGDLQINLVEHDREQSHAIAVKLRPALQAIAQKYAAKLKLVEVPPGPPVQAPLYLEIYGAESKVRRAITASAAAVFAATDGVVDVDSSNKQQTATIEFVVDQARAQQLQVNPAAIVQTLTSAKLLNKGWVHSGNDSKLPLLLTLKSQYRHDIDAILALKVSNANGELIALSELVKLHKQPSSNWRYRKDLLPFSFVSADVAGAIDSPLYAMFGMRAQLQQQLSAYNVEEYFINAPTAPYANYAIKWDGEWQITYETFRDMGIAYAVGLLIIYLLVVAHFGSYKIPLIIMVPIPLTVIGVMPGHALFGAEFTATSMIGMIALAGIIVRNSILLVDFIRLELEAGQSLATAIVQSAATRAKPILLTGFAAMIGAFFILSDPIFNGLAIALIFGILLASLMSLILVPLLFYVMYRHEYAAKP